MQEKYSVNFPPKNNRFSNCSKSKYYIILENTTGIARAHRKVQFACGQTLSRKILNCRKSFKIVTPEIENDLRKIHIFLYNTCKFHIYVVHYFKQKISLKAEKYLLFVNVFLILISKIIIFIKLKKIHIHLNKIYVKFIPLYRLFLFL